MVVLAATGCELPAFGGLQAYLRRSFFFFTDLADTYRPGSGDWTWIWRILHVKGGGEYLRRA